MSTHSIAAVNMLAPPVKEAIYTRFIPPALLSQFGIGPAFRDPEGRSLLDLRCAEGATDVVLALRRSAQDLDPLLYAHLTDTVTGQVHVLLYVVNDPTSPRFDVDRMPDGRRTEFGSFLRNLEAERAAVAAGLAPGQTRRGLRVLRHSIQAFEEFVVSLGHDLYFVEPLYYHNAVVFERYGFAYQQGRKLMEEVQSGFARGGAFVAGMDGSTVFRQRGAQASIRGRSWAIHDGILRFPFADVSMYKRVGKEAGISTFPDGVW
jgi:hypothetical protein